jgi:anti-sigma factor RsiW
MSNDFHPHDHALDAYLKGAVASYEAREITAHLADCATCRDRLARSDRFAESVSDLKDSIGRGSSEHVHLSFDDQLAPYVDERLAAVDAEIVESHLETCPQCAAEVEDLRGFRRLLENSERASVTGSRFTGRRAPWIAAAAALLILLGIGWWRVTQRPRREQISGEVAQRKTPGTERSALQASIAVIRDESGNIVLERDGTVRGLPTHDAQWQALIAGTLRNRTLSIPNIPEFRHGRETLLGPADRLGELNLIEPVNVVVADDQPTFRWTGPKNAQYVVEVYDEDFKLVAASQRLRGTFWTADRPLRRSALYSWQLAGRINGREVTVPVPPSPPARFKVVSAPDTAEIARARAIDPPSHLLLAVVYAKAGLQREAEQEIRKLADQNPHSAIPADLLRSLRAE